jgi:cytochrome c oxidase accessory protein FixG
MWFFVPPEEFFIYLQNPMEHTVFMGIFLILSLFLIYDVIFLKENFCFYICPYSRVQSVMYDNDTIMAIYHNNRGGNIYDSKEKVIFKTKDLENGDECTTCEKCVTVCPTHIDIRKGLQMECINCLECVDACTSVMGKLGKESLVNWSSWNETDHDEKTNFFRNKILAYIAVLVFVFGGLIAISVERKHMILNINRTTQLYSIKDDKSVTNSYIFLVTNTESKKHKYYFDVEGDDNIEIVRPKEPFTVKSGSKIKKVVVLKIAKKIKSDNRKDTIFPITIKAFAVDAKETINIDKDSIFVYPKTEEFK